MVERCAYGAKRALGTANLIGRNYQNRPTNTYKRHRFPLVFSATLSGSILDDVQSSVRSGLCGLEI